MKIKKNVEAPISIRGRKYTELWAAVIEMPIDSWIEVDFEKPIESRHKAAIYNTPGNRVDFKLRVIETNKESKIAIGKLSIE